MVSTRNPFRRLAGALMRPDEPGPDTPDNRPDSPDTGVPHPVGPSRLPDWWAPHKPDLAVDEDTAQPRTLLTKDRDEDDEPNDEADDPADEDSGDEVAKEPARRRWLPRGGQHIYRRPTFRDDRPAPKQALIGWWLHLPARYRWGLYNGTALAAGFTLGVPQFFTAETAYLVHAYGTWTNPHVLVWYGMALALWMLDHRTRAWLPPFALAARMPLVSMVVGVLLYGADLPA